MLTSKRIWAIRLLSSRKLFILLQCLYTLSVFEGCAAFDNIAHIRKINESQLPAGNMMQSKHNKYKLDGVNSTVDKRMVMWLNGACMW